MNQIYTQVEVRLTYDAVGKTLPIALLDPSDDASSAAQFLGRWLLTWRDEQNARDAVSAAENIVDAPDSDADLMQRTWRREDNGEVYATGLYTRSDGPPPYSGEYPLAQLLVEDKRVTTRGN